MITAFQIFKTIAALTFVCLVAVVVLRRWGHLLDKKIQGKNRNSAPLSLIESVALSDQHSLHIVSLHDGQQLFVSTTPAGTTVHGEIVAERLLPFAQSSIPKQMAPKKLSVIGSK